MSQPANNIPKLLRTISNRKKISQSSKGKSRANWPTQSSFTLLNKTQMLRSSSRVTQKESVSAFVTDNDEARHQAVNTVEFMTFSRPRTCGEPRERRKQLKKKGYQSQSISLFNGVKMEKLAKLKEERENLMNLLHDTDKIQIHRYDEEEDVSEKPNAMNFKTYHFLNKLMAIKEEIHHTSNQQRRPQTGNPLRRPVGRQY